MANTYYRYSEEFGWQPFSAVDRYVAPSQNNDREAPHLLIADGGQFKVAVTPSTELMAVNDQEFDNLDRHLRFQAHEQLIERRAPEMLTELHHAQNDFLAPFQVPAEVQADDVKWAFLHDEIEAAIDECMKRIRAAGAYTGYVDPADTNRYVFDPAMWEPLFRFDFGSSDPLTALAGGLGIAVSGSGLLAYRPRPKGNTNWNRRRTIKGGHTKLDTELEHWIQADFGEGMVIVNLGGGEVTVQDGRALVNINAGRIATLAPCRSHLTEGTRPGQTIDRVVSYRAYNTNADLRGIAVFSGSGESRTRLTLSPAFAADTLAYTVEAAAGADITVIADRHSTNRAKEPVTVTEGDTHTITVTAEDGSTTKTYTVTISRTPE